MGLGSLAKTLREEEEEMRFRKRKENGLNGQSLDAEFQSYSREYFENEKARFEMFREAARREKRRRDGKEYVA